MTRQLIIRWMLAGACSLHSLVATAQEIEISSTIRDTSGAALEGLIDVIEEGPEFSSSTHLVGRAGEFQVQANVSYGVVVRARAENHPPDERYIPPATKDAQRIEFVLPFAQQLTGRIIDTRGFGIAGATVHVRYHEPDRPPRRSAFHDFYLTDPDGYYVLEDVAIGEPFLVDVFAQGYRPTSSPPMTAPEGITVVEDIELAQKGGDLVVRVIDSSGSSVGGADVTMLANPAGYRPHERGSILHGRAFHQRATTSAFGNVRFLGVPPGEVIVHARSVQGEAVLRTEVSEVERLRLTLRLQ